ncbi:MAG: L,D-transpeptidase [Leptolyngbyaceae cyanobacterium bins.349]|nr:L,D-transpeptidase [Leptolyngbyaceae cyanobacterium bins.349]
MTFLTHSISRSILRLERFCLSLVLSTGICLVAEQGAPPGQAQVIYLAQFKSAMMDLKRSQQRWIEIDLSSQRLYAWEGDRPVYAILVSTGKASTPTPTGTFAIQSRHRSARMQGDDYDVPDVPYTLYYHRGYAIHGAYWHHRFGTPVSHGCTNVAVNHARWLYHWASVGTPIVVHE